MEITSFGAKNQENDLKPQMALILQLPHAQWHQMHLWLLMHLGMTGQEDARNLET